MWGNLSYLISTLIFAGTPAIFELIFGFHYLKFHFKAIKKLVLLFLVIVPFIELVAIDWRAWGFNPERNLGVFVLRSPIETLIVAIFISLTVSFVTSGWTFYEDKKKPIIKTSIYDVFHGTYVIWKKEKKV